MSVHVHACLLGSVKVYVCVHEREGERENERECLQNAYMQIGETVESEESAESNSSYYQEVLQITFVYSAGPQISCFPPSNFTIKQASYVDTYCWDSLMHHEFDSNGNFEERSLWVHKVS